MSKRVLILIAISTVVAVAAGLWATGEVLAQEGSFGARLKIARRGLAQVTSIEDDQFTVQKRDGETYTILVDEETVFKNKDQEELGYEDLAVDGWVVVIPKRTETDELLARLVFILPEDFDPTQFAGARGLIASVDLAANQFTLETKDGELFTYNMTIFLLRPYKGFCHCIAAQLD